MVCKLCCLYFSAGEPDLKTGKKREQLLQKQPKAAKKNRDQRISQLEDELQLREKEIISLKKQLENKDKKIKPEIELQSKEKEKIILTSKLHVWRMFWMFSIPSVKGHSSSKMRRKAKKENGSFVVTILQMEKRHK